MEIKSEMAGTVLLVNVGPGDAITAGDELLVMESMKMEMPVLATASGSIASVYVADGDVVEAGQVILSID
ncbi:acetyl-CoA carboxylase biotin carboxyl carrier protein subunit [Pseudomonas sp. dw_358]|uniref:acetyl-CoA carboxylase biotin carboxyl carrier protein subunit n=1 Tax=Pseudomonas sp. dw_358 TaxID=2720083 RepID=UPI001BD63E77|nr:acetyl-CoA carboxylase biotin carboxyl carrier protein subunit [Pseudomonas sp. dw_358]